MLTTLKGCMFASTRVTLLPAVLGNLRSPAHVSSKPSSAEKGLDICLKVKATGVLATELLTKVISTADAYQLVILPAAELKERGGQWI